MNSSDGDHDDISRRSFLRSGSGLFASVWFAAQWPSIAAAAHHAELVGAAAPTHFEFFDAADAADVEAICAQIVPSGATPGAREAHAVYFIDRSLATYFSAMAPGYRQGLAHFQAKFRSANPTTASFAATDSAAQLAFLKTSDQGPFFEMTRMLTVLGMFTSPRYGGNFGGSGWQLMGFVDQHAFTPPYQRTHDVPNLFVCDGSSVVTSGRGQPTMTIQALAFRAGDDIGRFAKHNEI